MNDVVPSACPIKTNLLSKCSGSGEAQNETISVFIISSIMRDIEIE